jgi:DNA-binding SARP family transcriptional activator/tetratricopeptide (TPR) repeat protein
MESLSVRVLGEFEVAGIEPAALGSRKGRSLLRFLALAGGHAVSVDTLATAIWGEQQPNSPADQIAVLVSRLRAVLGRERLEHTDAGYRLRYDWLDADELASLVAAVDRRLRDGNVGGAAAAARVSVSLIRGDLPAESDPWAEARRAELDRLVARTRRLAAAALTASGQWMEAADVAATAVRRDPYDEDSVRLLMRAYVAGGRVGSALSVYADLRQVLSEDLGTDPSPETDALHAAILRGELAASPSSATSTVPRLVGRAAELDRLDAIANRARAGSFEVAVVEGEAGIGKTSLLRTWAARRAAIGDVVLSASCGALDRAVPLDAVLAAIGAHLRAAGPDHSIDVLGADGELLMPMLGLAAGGVSSPAVADGVVGPFPLFAAVLRVLQRLAQYAPLVLVLDDVQLAGPLLAEWVEFIRRRSVAMVVVVGVRIGGDAFSVAGERIKLGPLDPAAVLQLVGESRSEQMYALSGGHPLLLAELAASPDVTQLSASLVQLVSARCDELGPVAAATLRSAAVIGEQLDVDLLAAVLRRPVLDVLADAERALASHLLVDEGGAFWFRHALVRSALEASATASRTAVLHREASRVLAQRRDADPVQVADHARRGGDTLLAATSLRAAARRAAQRFDHATAEGLLDESLQLYPDAGGWLERARVRTLRGRYAQAYEDVERAAPAGALALEVGAWASYFDRRFDQAIQYARDGEVAAEDDAVRARCLTVGGRTRHAAGDLAGAQDLLTEALGLATGADRVTASAWLGVLRTHQSRVDEALPLMRPAAREHVGVEHTSATLHSLLFTGHAHALAGRPADALDWFDRYTEAVDRRDVPRFAGRGVNSAGWVLRNIGAADEAVDKHNEALEIADRGGTVEVAIAALEDLADDGLQRGDVDAAATRLGEATSLLHGDLVFGWRLAMKLKLLEARLALARSDYEQAAALAGQLAASAADIDVPRYFGVARLIGHRARGLLGQAVDMTAVEADLDLVDRSVAIEAWWGTGQLAADLHVPKWVDRAADSVTRLAAAAGERGPAMRATTARLLDQWRAAARE